jgi:hypothetical protein
VPDTKILEYLILWLAPLVVIVLARVRGKMAGTGLVVAYLVQLGLIHWVAPVLYTLPWYRGMDPHVVEAGLVQSLYAVCAFAFGSAILGPFLMQTGLLPKARTVPNPDKNLPTAYIWIGAGSYLVMSFGIGALPSATALFATGQQMIVVGLALSAWAAWRSHDYGKLSLWIAVTLLLPFVTIITRGFIGYGTAATLTILIFVFGFLRSRVVVLLTLTVLAYLGLSVYVTYMRDRGEIRESVWGGQSLSDRMERIGTTASGFEWFDIRDQSHLQRIDGRLNQDFLVGAAVLWLEDTDDFARGETFWQALIALIPRALWPDKPGVAGSGNLVSEYTGIQFAAGTSVGIGQVMEFYINFGTFGVVFGFIIFGLVVTICDTCAGERLASGDLYGFVLWYMPGLSMLQVGGSLAEITSSVAASVFVALMVNKYLSRVQHKKADEAAILRPALASST